MKRIWPIIFSTFITLLSHPGICRAQKLNDSLLSTFYNKALSYYFSDSLVLLHQAKFDYILMKTELNPAGLIKHLGAKEVHYFSAKADLHAQLTKPLRKNTGRSLYWISHTLSGKNTIDVDIGGWTIEEVRRKSISLGAWCGGTMGYIPLMRFVFDPSSSSWSETSREAEIKWERKQKETKTQFITIFKDLQYDRNLNNRLFSKTDTFRDSLYLHAGLSDYFNVPIRAKVYTSGDCYADTLLFCNCMKQHDSTIITISGPSMCCFNELTLILLNGKFSSAFRFSYDVSPADVHLFPIRQTLVLKNDIFTSGALIEGYFDFSGLGNYSGNERRDLTTEEKRHGFSGNAQGFFKCRIE
jgi:hypothetical protein